MIWLTVIEIGLKIIGYVFGFMKGNKEKAIWLAETSEILRQKGLVRSKYVLELEAGRDQYLEDLMRKKEGQPVTVSTAKPDAVNEAGSEWLEKAIAIIKKFEGYRSKAYQDSVGVWTIGYGTIKYSDGVSVKSGDVITEAQAFFYLADHIEKEILKPMAELVKVRITFNQYSALISFVYNLGIGNFQRSTLLKKLNIPNFNEAGDQFLVWNKAGGKVLPGLVTRRAMERELFSTPDVRTLKLS